VVEEVTGEQRRPGDDSADLVVHTPPPAQVRKVAPPPKVGHVCTMNDNH